MQDCRAAHIGGDLNDKVTTEAQKLLDSAFNSTMEELKLVLSGLSAICTLQLQLCDLIIDLSTTSSNSLVTHDSRFTDFFKVLLTD